MLWWLPAARSRTALLGGSAELLGAARRKLWVDGAALEQLAALL